METDSMKLEHLIQQVRKYVARMTVMERDALRSSNNGILPIVVDVPEVDGIPRPCAGSKHSDLDLNKLGFLLLVDKDENGDERFRLMKLDMIDQLILPASSKHHVMEGQQPMFTLIH